MTLWYACESGRLGVVLGVGATGTPSYVPPPPPIKPPPWAFPGCGRGVSGDVCIKKEGGVEGVTAARVPGVEAGSDRGDTKEGNGVVSASTSAPLASWPGTGEQVTVGDPVKTFA
mgnify:CR=1 FL=1